MIFRIRPEAQGRLLGCYMLFYSAGVGLGAWLSTFAYAHFGWGGVCALGATFSAMAIAFWGVTLRLTSAHVASA